MGFSEKKKSSSAKDLKKVLVFVCGLIILIIAALSAMSYKSNLKKLAPLGYSELVNKYALEYSIDKSLIYSVIKTESGFNPNAVSVDDARGLMQITSPTFDWLMMKTKEKHTIEELFDPETNIRYGTYFLRLLLDEFENLDCVLAAYNAGRGRVNGWLQDAEYSSDGKTLKSIPISETNYYVIKVKTAIELYEKLYNFDAEENTDE